MNAIIYDRYGPPNVLKIKEIKKPIPKDNEILIKVHATTVSSGDSRLRGFNVPFLISIPYRLIMGITGPRNKILGFTFSGVIE